MSFSLQIFQISGISWSLLLRDTETRYFKVSPLWVTGRTDRRRVFYSYRASDISRKKKENFAGFSGANSRKNRPISRDFRGKKVKICGKIGRFLNIFAGKSQKSRKNRPISREKSQNSRKNRPISREKSQNSQKNRPISRDFSGKKSNFKGFSGQILGKIGRSENFGGKLRPETISKKQPISLDFFGKFR